MFRIEWLGLAILLALTVSAREPAAPPIAEPTWTCSIPDVSEVPDDQGMRARAISEADALYRRGDPARAALRITVVSDTLPEDTELRSLAELYTVFAYDLATAMDAASPPIPAFIAVQRAQSLDISLGGVFAERLNLRVRSLAPAAAVAYDRASDKTGAALARHTADVFK